ncbi:MAG: SpaA isopeptide-forming pilin-related protein [Bacillota bacterium]
MKAVKHVLAILMTAIMIFCGTSLDGFGAFSFAEENTAPSTEAVQDAGDASKDVTGTAQDEDGAAGSEDPELVHRTLKASKVRLEGMMPEGAKATATDAASAKAVRKIDTEGGTMLAAYDITIKADGEEYQPDSDNPITVQISNSAIKADSDLTIWHIRDDGSKEQIRDFDVSDGKVTFEATGFSVYVIVEGPDPVSPGSPTKVQTQQELTQHYADAKGFYLSYGNTYYFKNTINNKGAYHETTDITAAAKWFLEKVSGQNNRYRVYTVLSGSNQYMRNTTGNEMGLTDNSSLAAEFDITEDSAGKFLFKLVGANKWLQHSGSGSGIRLWTDADNTTNSRISLTYVSSTEYPNDPYGLDGKSYGIINYRGGTSAAALLDRLKSNNNYRMEAQSVQVRVDPIKKTSGDLVIAKDSDIPFWTITNLHNDIYTLTAADGRYLRIMNNEVTVTSTKDEYCELKIIPCEGEENAGKIRIANCDGYELNINGGKVSNGFYARINYTGPDNRMTLIELSDVYDDDDFVEYTAKKVSVSDTEKVTNGSCVVIYTRVWNEETKKYDFYAIDHEGDLVYCYETGDHIMWTGASVNTMLWEFTEYYYEGTNNPNYYYELQNTYSGKYIAPKISGGVQTLSDTKIGINLEGRRDGEYSSTILAWDDPQYDYAGLKVNVNNLELTADLMADADTFYFAIMDEESGTLTPVNTVDHEAEANLTMKMVDFSNVTVPPGTDESPSSVEQYEVMGEQKYTQSASNPGLLSYDIQSDGYPVVEETGTSLAHLFDASYKDVKQVNHLFLRDTYEESGYFVYDSSQNFAHLDTSERRFSVYKELGTTELRGHNDTLAHGQFMPYNNLDVPHQSTEHPENLTDITAKELPDDNPRKGETLYRYGVNGTPETQDYYFGMEIDGYMMQTPSGKDRYGHDIIFEFTGDDDFWLYVDDLLVLDLGGIHKALAGSINYSTGEVIVNGTQTTLRDMFKKSYAASRGISEDSQEVTDFLNSKFRLKNGSYVFKDYSLHEIKIFYMERGGGASNLRMRFNMSSVTPGHVLLSKELSGSDQDKYAGVKFPYQIFYDTTGEGNYEQLKDTESSTPVVYQGTETGVEFKESVEVGGTSYDNVYYLKPGEIADITLPDNTVDYYVVECGVNDTIFDEVEINGGPDADPDNVLTKTERAAGFYDYKTSSLSSADRSKVIFTNYAKAASLRTINVKKKLVDENGNEIDDDTGFRFRMHLGPEDDPDYYRLGAYYVRDPSGNYCRYDSASSRFVSLGVSDFDSLSDLQKKQARFTTSPSGAIDKIPTGYSFEIRDILIGTYYNVEERSSDLPKGYAFREFTTGAGYSDNSGLISEESDTDIKIEAVNEKGMGLTANKIWSDEDCTAYHEDIYLAVYDGDELLVGDRADLGLDGQKYIKRIRTKLDGQDVPDRSVYFFIPIEERKQFSDYTIKEVKLDEGAQITIGKDGFVTGYTGSVTPVTNPTSIKASLDGTEPLTAFDYTVTVDKGETPTGENTRLDVVTNTRANGIALIKEDMDGNPLPGAVFTLKKGDTPVGDGMFTSGAGGVITTMYDYDEGVDYTLTEIEAPGGYTGIPSPVTIRVDSSTGEITAAGEGLDDYVVVDQGGSGEIPSVTIKNRQSVFVAYKVDAGGNYLAGAQFSLSRQVKDKEGKLRKDYYPLEGYEYLPSQEGTGDDGVIMSAAKTRALKPGTYYLTETETPSGFERLSGDLLFNISELGVVTITTDETNTQDYSSYLTTEGTGTENDPLTYVLKVENSSTDVVAPTGYSDNILPFMLMLTAGLLLGVATLYFRRRRIG